MAHKIPRKSPPGGARRAKRDWPNIGVDSEQLLALLGHAQAIGAIGRASLADHMSQAAAFFRVIEELVEPTARLLDLGSGGGIPGLVIADRWRALDVTLLDGRLNRAAMLEEMVSDLGWQDRVHVICERAETAGRSPRFRGSFSVVVARGFGPPAVTAECAAPFLQLGGLLVVSDPPGPGESSRWPAQGCGDLGLRYVRHHDEPWSISVLIQDALCPERYPRRVGVPRKRPLF